jgi:two-component system nitrate/nitrite response regulator NarL
MELAMMGETIFPPAFLSFVLDPEGALLGEAAPRDENNQAMPIRAKNTFAPPLSAREKLIVRCLIEGDSNKWIARKINIAEETVKIHVKAILRKIRVQNRTQAAIWGMNNETLTRPATNVGKQLPKPVEVLSVIKQIGASVPLGAIKQEANNVDVSRIIRLNHKVHQPKN